IGAVKMKGGRLVEEWSTLLNPGRRIPKKIVSLTGITDEMVSDAPVFAEIADEFRAFLGDAVFAAHRAAFDYGFIREEYRRIGEPFSAPSLCTCVSMRRCFPGLASYGLANLCREFNVPLENHHRALADARATAQLLLRINERRLEQEREEKSVSRDRQ
ncbi:MAG: 3'-5' exonuclease, partial [Verrucomicrobiota bacterium]